MSEITGGRQWKTARAVVVWASDGKTLIVTTAGTNAPGQKLNNVQVFEKE